MNEKIELAPVVKDLLAEVNQLYPDGTVMVHFGDQKAGFVRHDQASQQAMPGALEIMVNDVTAPILRAKALKLTTMPNRSLGAPPIIVLLLGA